MKSEENTMSELDGFELTCCKWCGEVFEVEGEELRDVDYYVCSNCIVDEINTMSLDLSDWTSDSELGL